jgi:hypothetical protein
MWALRWLASGVFAVAILAAATLAWAETVAGRDTPAALERALRVETACLRAPSARRLERWAELAQWCELRADPECLGLPTNTGRTRTWQALRRVVEVDPRRSSAWIALGLSAEQAGDWSEAERDLLEAARVDRQYLPAWTLANFYFRRGAEGAFWRWARLAALLTYDDFRPLLRLTGAFDADPARVLNRLGDGMALERGYITYLIGVNRLEAAQQVARRLAARRPSDTAMDRGLFTDLTERSIRTGQVGPALEFWNAVHAPALNPGHGPILTNADFAHAPTAEGFDWRIAAGGEACPGTSGAWSPGQVRFHLSGGQSEDCLLLQQTLPVTSGTVYRLRFDYRTEGLAGSSGLRWTFDRIRSPENLAASAQWSFAEATFHARSAGLATLEFWYHRDPGTIRQEGSVLLRNAHMEPQ